MGHDDDVVVLDGVIKNVMIHGIKGYTVWI